MAPRIRCHEPVFAPVPGTNFVNLSPILIADGLAAAGPVIDEPGRFAVVSALLARP